jgi:hypothetical protein
LYIVIYFYEKSFFFFFSNHYFYFLSFWVEKKVCFHFIRHLHTHGRLLLQPPLRQNCTHTHTHTHTHTYSHTHILEWLLRKETKLKDYFLSTIEKNCTYIFYFVIFSFPCTVKLVYNDHPRDPKLVAVVDRWSLFRGSFML